MCLKTNNFFLYVALILVFILITDKTHAGVYVTSDGANKELCLFSRPSGKNIRHHASLLINN